MSPSLLHSLRDQPTEKKNSMISACLFSHGLLNGTHNFLFFCIVVTKSISILLRVHQRSIYLHLKPPCARGCALTGYLKIAWEFILKQRLEFDELGPVPSSTTVNYMHFDRHLDGCCGLQLDKTTIVLLCDQTLRL